MRTLGGSSHLQWFHELSHHIHNISRPMAIGRLMFYLEGIS
jgi:hypothetical protein